MFKRRKTYEQNLAEIREQYGPPPIYHHSCDVCGDVVTDEVVHTFVPSPLTGSRKTRRFCREHGRQFHNAIADLFDYNHIPA